MQLLKGRKVLITGGTSGIGKEIARQYIIQGADVAILGTNHEKAMRAKTEIEQNKIDPNQIVLTFLVDVSKSKEVDQKIQELLLSWGKIDILVNSAGITRDNLLMKMTEEDWDHVINTNLKSVYNTCRSIARSMIKARFGVIINITSVIGLTGNAGQVNYAASKSGMIGFSKSLAKELASRNIRVNCIAPGYIETQMTDSLSASVKEAIISKIPLGCIGTPDDIAAAAVFLASDQSRYITGQVITVDGGMVI